MTQRSEGDQAAVPFRTAIVPAAGLGTRFLPATKTVPKELLPVLDTPGIELVAGEAADAGAQRLIVITGEGKHGVIAHFRHDDELEATLAERGKTELLEKVRRGPDLIAVEEVEQPSPRGLGHAIGCAEGVLGEDEQAVAVLLPDDLVLPVGVLEEMERVRRECGGSVLCAFNVPPDQVSSYGVFDVGQDPASTQDPAPGVLRVRRMVEKPAPEDAPSTLAAAGRYILDRAIFDALRRITPGAGGELQLTDAVELLIEEGHPVHVVVHSGIRHDLGNPGGYVRAVVDFALESLEYGEGFRSWLRGRLAGDGDAPGNSSGRDHAEGAGSGYGAGASGRAGRTSGPVTA